MATPALIVEDLTKTFHVPKQHVSTLKERALHPFRRSETVDYEVLKGVSFEVGQGEFFGIVGRNGSGKSTLLKCMAGIYGPDSGRIASAGRVAPFIELGVGFNMDLTAYENVTINGVMMGLTPREARRRFDEVIEFAELGDFLDLKLKNYSSGMQVRLAFSVMVQSDADVFLIDEVLAVGDAAFQQKCLDVFYHLRDQGKTIVLVTHDMSAVERFCHRAMFIRDGVVEMIGDPLDVGGAYIDANFEKAEVEPSAVQVGEFADWQASAVAVDGSGAAVSTQRSGLPIRIEARMTPPVDVDYPELFLVLRDALHRQVTGVMIDFDGESLRAGEPIEVSATFEAELAESPYHVGFHLYRAGGPEPLAENLTAYEFIVHGARRVVGAIKVPTQVVIERGAPPTQPTAPSGNAHA
ncbi:MAG: ABC transporter ATP-binding protein [Thermoleophilaceae bacterium]|nr:ABC transporter ATP-binding protein [Thermoleophilaceae bacterium]